MLDNICRASVCSGQGCEVRARCILSWKSPKRECSFAKKVNKDDQRHASGQKIPKGIPSVKKSKGRQPNVY